MEWCSGVAGGCGYYLKDCCMEIVVGRYGAEGGGSGMEMEWVGMEWVVMDVCYIRCLFWAIKVCVTG